ncbi:MAG: hypothetical protein ACOY82_17895 [Pseudomonadota bacterium]
MNRRRFPFALSSALVCAALAGLAACDREAPADVAEPVVAPPAAPAPAAPAPAAPAASPSASGASGAAALIGTRVPPYPDGLSEIGGSCVPGGEGIARVCEFGLAMVGTGTSASGGAAMVRYVIASKNTDPAADKPTWQVLDAIDAPALQIGYDLQLGACSIDGQDNPGLIAAVRHGQDERSADITWARRFDTATGKLADVETARVSCLNTAAGV